MITQAIIEQCQNGETSAQRKVFAAYGELLFKVAWRYLHERMAAEDAVAQGFAKAFREMAKCQFDSVAKLEAWLRRIVVNEALGILRERYKWTWAELSELPQYATGIEEQLDDLSAAEILKLIAALPPGYRTVFNLAVIEGYSHPEIAKLLEITEGTSKSQLSKAKALLQSKIKKLYWHDFQK